ncbi:hypothetical protein PHLGIDRAFT_40436, partial [Phlebiopsis gigantea 11061_1 CR5-6]
MDWSIRRITKAGQKVPADAPVQLFHSFLRVVAAVRDENIADCLIVNNDQTMVLFSHGNKVTFAPRGAKQVAGEGFEEKRAFTLMVGVSLGGEVLPFQAIYQGASVSRSLPKKTAPLYSHATSTLSMRFEVSKTTTHWSNLDTMKSYVTHILVPYFRVHIEQLQLPDDQRCLWLVDVWSVHRSEAFRNWMKASYPWIIINYVPGGCTGL